MVHRHQISFSNLSSELSFVASIDPISIGLGK